MFSDQWLPLLIAQSLQVAILSIVIWILARTFAKNRPHLAHALWLLVILKVVTPPIFSSPTGTINLTRWIATNELSHDQSEHFSSNQIFPANSIASSPEGLVASPANHQSTKTQAEERSKRNSRLLSTDANTASDDLSHLTLLIWLLGASVGFFVLVIHYGKFSRTLKNSPRIQNEPIQSLAMQLTEKLGVHRKVNIQIVDDLIGPFVYGLLRPTIVLPVELVKGKSHKQLEPLLAHELIHLRRGDLWWALLQCIARNLFWFHPLVVLADRSLTREAERCCDEETIASLGCKPSEYARCLLNVLELKKRLQPAPALPGVRPVDITSNRLERVMKLGNGMHRRTPLWTWPVLLIGCLLVLPGAAWLRGQEKNPNEQAKPSEEACCFQICIVEASNEAIGKLPIEWKTTRPERPGNAGNDENETQGLTTLIKQHVPTRIGSFPKAQQDKYISILQENGCKVASAPTIMTLLNRQANFLSGGEIPVTYNGEMEFLTFGTKVNLLPTKSENDSLDFQLDLELSSLRKNPEPPTDDSFARIVRTNVAGAVSASLNETTSVHTEFENEAGQVVPVLIFIKCSKTQIGERQDSNPIDNPDITPSPTDAQRFKKQ
ncbi:MAG: M56 family metallopeptidase [Pirellulaceae bacterium]